MTFSLGQRRHVNDQYGQAHRRGRGSTRSYGTGDPTPADLADDWVLVKGRGGGTTVYDPSSGLQPDANLQLTLGPTLSLPASGGIRSTGRSGRT